MPGLAVAIGLALSVTVSGPALEREARAIDEMLVAPCCFSQQVSIHQSAAAMEVRRDVRERLAAGQTRQQILNAYVARYGKRILVEPPAAGFDLTLYITPAIVFLASIAIVVLVLRRVALPAASAPEPAAGTGDPDIESRLDDELRDLD